MKRFIFVILIAFFCINFCLADTCPTAESLGLFHTPPPGWSTLIGAPPGDDYYFSEAVHSFNGTFYYKQVICRYEECPNCFAFELLSDETYQLPNSNAPPWGAPSAIKWTYTCKPSDHNPDVCVFGNPGIKGID
jgi:hypothetical protein